MNIYLSVRRCITLRLINMSRMIIHRAIFHLGLGRCTTFPSLVRYPCVTLQLVNVSRVIIHWAIVYLGNWGRVTLLFDVFKLVRKIGLDGLRRTLLFELETFLGNQQVVRSYKQQFPSDCTLTNFAAYMDGQRKRQYGRCKQERNNLRMHGAVRSFLCKWEFSNVLVWMINWQNIQTMKLESRHMASFILDNKNIHSYTTLATCKSLCRSSIELSISTNVESGTNLFIISSPSAAIDHKWYQITCPHLTTGNKRP